MVFVLYTSAHFGLRRRSTFHIYASRYIFEIPYLQWYDSHLFGTKVILAASSWKEPLARIVVNDVSTCHSEIYRRATLLRLY